MAWEENSRICLHMQLIAILSRIGVYFKVSAPSGCVGKNLRNLNYKETLNRLFMLKKSEIIHF